MKKWKENLQAKLRRFLYGRYGYDELFRPVGAVAVAFWLLACVPKLRFLRIPGTVLWLWTLFRCLSRNTAKRRAERDAYLGRVYRIKDWFYWKRQAWLLRDTYRFYRCRQCRKMLRVPRGKGKIKITCPQCRNQITRKT